MLECENQPSAKEIWPQVKCLALSDFPKPFSNDSSGQLCGKPDSSANDRDVQWHQVTFDASDVQPAHRFDASQAYFDGLCELKPIGDVTVPYEVRNTSWCIGDYVANRAVHGPTSITMCNEEITRGYLALRYFSQGAYQNVSDQSIRQLGPGMLSSGADLDGFTRGGFEYYSLEVPVDAMEMGILSDGAFRAVSVDSPHGRVLFRMMQQIFGHLSDGRGNSTEPLAHKVTALFEVLAYGLDTAEEAARPAFLRARASAMERYIDDHLDDPNLGPAHLANAFGMSRAGVFRVFEPYGGVATAIAHRRMVRAYQALTQALPKRGIVRLVAESCGYPDPAHFCRVFRRHLDISPGDVAGIRRPEALGEVASDKARFAKVPRLSMAYR